MNPATGDKPKVNEALVPPGAKMTDAEVANLLVVKVEGLLNICHTGLAQSQRDDVAALYPPGWLAAKAPGPALAWNLRLEQVPGHLALRLTRKSFHPAGAKVVVIF